RQLDQHIRLDALAVGTLEADLGVVLAPLLQTGMLQHPLQHQLAPVALGLLPLERAGQVGCLVAQALVELLQALQLLGQGEALARLVLIALLDTLLKRLNAFLERIEQLAKALLTGFGKTLLALIEDLSGQFGELRTQLIAGGLQISQTLLVMLLLLAQFGTHAGTLAFQATQLLFLVGALLRPFAGALLRRFTRLAKQFALTPQGGQFGLLPAIVLLLAA